MMEVIRILKASEVYENIEEAIKGQNQNSSTSPPGDLDIKDNDKKIEGGINIMDTSSFQTLISEFETFIEGHDSFLDSLEGKSKNISDIIKSLKGRSFDEKALELWGEKIGNKNLIPSGITDKTEENDIYIKFSKMAEDFKPYLDSDGEKTCAGTLERASKMKRKLEAVGAVYVALSTMLITLNAILSEAKAPEAEKKADEKTKQSVFSGLLNGIDKIVDTIKKKGSLEGTKNSKDIKKAVGATKTNQLNENLKKMSKGGKGVTKSNVLDLLKRVFGIKDTEDNPTKQVTNKSMAEEYDKIVSGYEQFIADHEKFLFASTLSRRAKVEKIVDKVLEDKSVDFKKAWKSRINISLPSKIGSGASSPFKIIEDYISIGRNFIPYVVSGNTVSWEGKFKNVEETTNDSKLVVNEITALNVETTHGVLENILNDINTTLNKLMEEKKNDEILKTPTKAEKILSGESVEVVSSKKATKPEQGTQSNAVGGSNTEYLIVDQIRKANWRKAKYLEGADASVAIGSYNALVRNYQEGDESFLKECKKMDLNEISDEQIKDCGGNAEKWKSTKINEVNFIPENKTEIRVGELLDKYKDLANAYLEYLEGGNEPRFSEDVESIYKTTAELNVMETTVTNIANEASIVKGRIKKIIEQQKTTNVNASNVEALGEETTPPAPPAVESQTENEKTEVDNRESVKAGVKDEEAEQAKVENEGTVETEVKKEQTEKTEVENEKVEGSAPERNDLDNVEENHENEQESQNNDNEDNKNADNGKDDKDFIDDGVGGEDDDKESAEAKKQVEDALGDYNEFLSKHRQFVDENGSNGYEFGESILENYNGEWWKSSHKDFKLGECKNMEEIFDEMSRLSKEVLKCSSKDEQETCSPDFKEYETKFNKVGNTEEGKLGIIKKFGGQIATLLRASNYTLEVLKTNKSEMEKAIAGVEANIEDIAKSFDGFLRTQSEFLKKYRNHRETLVKEIPEINGSEGWWDGNNTTYEENIQCKSINDICSQWGNILKGMLSYKTGLQYSTDSVSEIEGKVSKAKDWKSKLEVIKEYNKMATKIWDRLNSIQIELLVKAEDLEGKFIGKRIEELNLKLDEAIKRYNGFINNYNEIATEIRKKKMAGVESISISEILPKNLASVDNWTNTDNDKEVFVRDNMSQAWAWMRFDLEVRKWLPEPYSTVYDKEVTGISSKSGIRNAEDKVDDEETFEIAEKCNVMAKKMLDYLGKAMEDLQAKAKEAEKGVKKDKKGFFSKIKEAVGYESKTNGDSKKLNLSKDDFEEKVKEVIAQRDKNFGLQFRARYVKKSITEQPEYNVFKLVAIKLCSYTRGNLDLASIFSDKEPSLKSFGKKLGEALQPRNITKYNVNGDEDVDVEDMIKTMIGIIYIGIAYLPSGSKGIEAACKGMSVGGIKEGKDNETLKNAYKLNKNMKKLCRNGFVGHDLVKQLKSEISFFVKEDKIPKIEGKFSTLIKLKNKAGKFFGKGQKNAADNEEKNISKKISQKSEKPKKESNSKKSKFRISGITFPFGKKGEKKNKQKDK